jgi:predicted nuclease of predicted toxin-antitoxin system
MRFLADMGVAPSIVVWLRERGHDAVHLIDEGLGRLPDAQIFAKALREQRILLTFDLDFGEIANTQTSRAASVVLFRLRNSRVAIVKAHLARCLETAAESLRAGAIIVVEDNRLRIRRPSIEQ